MPIDALEPRRLLSFTVSNGKVSITATAGGDAVVVSLVKSNISIFLNGATQTTPLAGVSRIEIFALAGNDIVTVNAGLPDTYIDGGAGNDSLAGGDGNDTLTGGAGRNTLNGNNGDDRLNGSGGRDFAFGGAGADRLYGIVGDDSLDGGGGVDRFFGGDGNDILLGGGSADKLRGEAGDDTLIGGTGADIQDGGPGNDTVDYSLRSASITATLDTGATDDGEAGEGDDITTVETVIGGSGADGLTGNNKDNRLVGNAGDDSIVGNDGDDTLLGGDGSESFSASDDKGADVFDGGPGNDSIFYPSPFDQLPVTVIEDSLPNDGKDGEGDNVTNIENIIGGDGDDTLIGDNADNFISSGGGLNNVLMGGGGNDSLSFGLGISNGFASGKAFGGDGNDTINSEALGAGASEMHGDAGDDKLFPRGRTNIVTGDAGNDLADYASVFKNSLTIDNTTAGLETILGSTGSDSIIGSDAAEVILGQSGGDTLLGKGGNDYLDGGEVNDTINGGAGDDVIVNGDGGTPDKVDGGDGFDLAQFDGGDDFGGPVFIPNDTINNVEFIYDPAAGVSSSNAQEINRDGSYLFPASAAAAAAEVPPGGAVVSGVLKIVGTSAADSISVILDKSATNIVVTQNTATKTFALGTVKSISIDAGGGNDAIALVKSDGTRAVPRPAVIAGGSGNDTITGGSGNDSLAGGKGNDALSGGAGNDNLNGGSDAFSATSDGADVLSGGAGNDSAIYSTRTDNLSIDLADSKKSNEGALGEGDRVLADIENVFSGTGDDNIVGNSSANLISGGDGDDTIKAGNGNDKLIGSRGADTLLGQGGQNLFSLTDAVRDDFDGGTVAFVSGDDMTDFNTVTGKVLGAP